MSRLTPMEAIKEVGIIDPYAFDLRRQQVFVNLRERHTGKDIPFDINSKIPSRIQEYLSLVNSVNSQFQITYQKYNTEHNEWGSEWKQLRPIHFASFTDNWDKHGRIYTGKDGHQALSKVERSKIHFGLSSQRDIGDESVEMDYSGLHTRLIYHSVGIDYRDDPYALWGEGATDSLRLLAKYFVNALINAESTDAAIQACNRKMSRYTGKKDAAGERIFKDGKTADDARKLRRAYLKSKITFKDILPIALKYHAPIWEHFGQDLGITLMRTDSKIALRVLYHFAKQSVPCLGCHDSFIVPRSYSRELFSIMDTSYLKVVGFHPIIK